MLRLVALLTLLAVPVVGDAQFQCTAVPCTATLYYRPITAGAGFLSFLNHSFWYTGYQYGGLTLFVAVEDGGPQNPGCSGGCGYLQAWYTPATVGHYPEDNVNTATLWWDTGYTYEACTAVTAITTYTQTFPNSSYIYARLSQNSNTFAHWAANNAGLTPPAPPSAQGW